MIWDFPTLAGCSARALPPVAGDDTISSYIDQKARPLSGGVAFCLIGNPGCRRRGAAAGGDLPEIPGKTLRKERHQPRGSRSPQLRKIPEITKNDPPYDLRISP